MDGSCVNAELASGACIGCGTVCPRSCCCCCGVGVGVGAIDCVNAVVAYCGCSDCGKGCAAG